MAARPPLTVILPCAGEGSRLGLNLPKPLYEVLPGLRLIDLSLMHLRLAARQGLRFQVAVVVKPETMAVWDYVREALPGMAVHACRFNPAYQEWPGSVFSAGDRFGPDNLVLLPDSIISLGAASRFFDPRGFGLVETMLEGLQRHPVYFLVIPQSGEKLRRLGAVHFEDGLLTRLGDKPDGDLTPFNAYWAAYAFRADHGEPLYLYLRAALAKHPEPFPLTRLGPPGAHPAFDYQDLGTWDALDGFCREYSDAASFWRAMRLQAGMRVE